MRRMRELDALFRGQPVARRLFTAVRRTVEAAGPCTLRVTRSQVAFRRRTGFAWAWMPGKWLRGQVAPLVLSISLPRRDRSRRWKEVVEPAPGRFMHHLELRDPSDLDDEVRAWVAEAWAHAA